MCPKVLKNGEVEKVGCFTFCRGKLLRSLLERKKVGHCFSFTLQCQPCYEEADVRGGER